MSESGVSPPGAGQPEVWLRANPRPVAALAAIVAACFAVAAAAAWLAGVGLAAMSVGSVVAATVAGGLLAAAIAAVQPRLVRRGDELEVRLSPLAVERVPLEVVECLFRGSEPLPEGRADMPPRFRVGTLVVRLAERAEAWRARPTFRPWGSWADGHIMIDGRWCEPLSHETVGRIAERLLLAKREAAEAAS